MPISTTDPAGWCASELVNMSATATATNSAASSTASRRQDGVVVRLATFSDRDDVVMAPQ
jgi:hypothetical protein